MVCWALSNSFKFAEKVEAGGIFELIQSSILSKLLVLLKDASLDNQVKILVVVKQFTLHGIRSLF
jgi:hypothetical protein